MMYAIQLVLNSGFTKDSLYIINIKNRALLWFIENMVFGIDSYQECTSDLYTISIRETFVE